MPCPTCDHTLQTVFADKHRTIRHCPRCGTLQSILCGHEDFAAPKLVECLRAPRPGLQGQRPQGRKAASEAYTGAPLDGPLALELTFVLPRPKYLCWKRRPMPRQWCPARPDADNLLKAVADALSGLLWRDDIQLADVRVTKYYAAGDEAPHALVLCRTLEVPAPVPAADSAPLFPEE